MATATLESYNQTPRKVRLVASLVKGKKVEKALEALHFLPLRAASPIEKLIKSAVANAKSEGKEAKDLTVENLVVESAGMLVRYMPRAFGRAAPIRRRKSRIKVTVS